MSWKAAMPLTVSILVVLFMVSTVQESRERSLEKRAMESTISADDSSSSNSQHTKEFFYDDQLVDHHDTEKHKTFTQRYYQKGDSFGGAGSPIFIIFGGEDPLENLLYPFIYDHLAQKFNAHTFALEHRFFGKSMPVKNATHAQLHQLLTPDQTLRDVARFIQHKRHELGCSLQRSSRRYCPAITVGGSYPGFLSGLMRFAHPDGTSQYCYFACVFLLIFQYKFSRLESLPQWSTSATLRRLHLTFTITMSLPTPTTKRLLRLRMK